MILEGRPQLVGTFRRAAALNRVMDPTPTDDDLLLAAQRDPDAFGAIFDRHFDALFRFAAHRIGRQAAEDVAAETFVRALGAVRRAHTTDGSLRAWLYAIAGNLIRDDLRSRARAGRVDDRLRNQVRTAPQVARPGMDVGDGPDPELLEAVRALRIEEQEVLLLHAWAELSYEEIAVATGVAVGTVRSRLSRARVQLRAALPEHGPTTESIR